MHHGHQNLICPMIGTIHAEVEGVRRYRLTMDLEMIKLVGDAVENAQCKIMISFDMPSYDFILQKVVPNAVAG
jgi:hypothetical protein